MLKNFLLLLLFITTAKDIFSQKPPDLATFRTLHDKVQAWHTYCNQLIGSGNIDNYKKLTIAGRQGMALVPNDSSRVKALFSLFAGVAHEHLKHYDSAVLYLTQAAAFARKTNHMSYEMLALTRLDNIYSYTSNTVLRKDNIKRMLQISDTSTDLKIKEQAADMLGGYYRGINDYNKSMDYKIRSINLYKELLKADTAFSTPLNLGYKLSNIGNLFNEIGQHNKAVEYLNEARVYIGDKALTGNEETLYIYYIQAFLGLDKTDSAEKYYQLIYQGMAGRDTLFNVMTTANYLFGKFYLNKSNIDRAYSYAVKSYVFGKKSPDSDSRTQSGQLLGSVFYEQGKYKEALLLLNSSLYSSFEFDRETYANIHQTIADCYAKTNNWDSAYKHFKIYSAINDSLLLASANKNFADAEAKFQNKEKQQQINNKNLQLSTSRKQQWWMIVGLTLLSLLAVLLIIIYRNKKRTAEVLDEKNIILAKLNTSLEEANQTKAKLFSIISHDLRSPISQVYQFLKLQQLNPKLLNEQQKNELSDKIQTATGSLLETMEDLLLWSKTQMSEFKTSMQVSPLLPVIDACKNLLKLNSDSKNIVYKNLIPADLSVNTDPYYLQNIIRNLLQNAIKASPENGEIEIGSRQTDGGLVIYIKNQGGAFTQQQYQHILTSEEAAKNLNGLGLRLVAELSDKIGASINFKTTNSASAHVEIAIPRT